MYEEKAQVTTLIIAVVIILLIMGVFLLVILSYYNNRKLRSIREKESLKKEFEQILLQTQVEVQEQTMRHISQEIHDNVQQILTLVNLNLKTLKSFDASKIESTSELVNKAIIDLRSLSKSLNPESLAKIGLTETVRSELEQLQRSGHFITSFSSDDSIKLPPAQLLILYRMVQEVLTNIIKHSNAQNVKATIKDNKLILQDDGSGFNVAEESNGLGLNNLTQRAKVIGAVVDIESVQGKGTSVTFKF